MLADERRLDTPCVATAASITATNLIMPPTQRGNQSPHIPATLLVVGHQTRVPALRSVLSDALRRLTGTRYLLYQARCDLSCAKSAFKS